VEIAKRKADGTVRRAGRSFHCARQRAQSYFFSFMRASTLCAIDLAASLSHPN